MSKKALKISIICMLVALLVATGSVFAYFSFLTNSGSGTADLSTAKTAVVEVGSFSDLIKYGTDKQYNPSNHKSAVVTRYLLKFTANISLYANVTLNNDVIIDLNNFTLTLNECDLTIDHTYLSTTIISNGKIESISETNKGCIYINSVSGIELSQFSGLSLKRNAEAYTSDINVISSYILNTGFNDADVLSCAETFVKNNITRYIRKDIELITNYKMYDIDFEYVSSNDSLISSSGKVTLPLVPEVGNQVGVDVTLTLTMKTLTASKTVDLNFTVIASSILDGSNNIGLLGKIFLTDYLSKYESNGTYQLNSDIVLPKANSYLGFNVTYATTPSYTVVETELGSENVYFLKDILDSNSTSLGNILTSAGYTGTIMLTPTITIGDVSVTIDSYTFEASTLTNNDKAMLLMEQVIPFLIKPNKTIINLFTSQQLAEYGVTSVTCTFTNNTYVDNGVTKSYYVYNQADSTITLADVNVKPSTSAEILANLTFNFEKNIPQTVTLSTRIYYDNTGEGGGSATEDIYRNLYNDILTEYAINAKSGNTYLTFTLQNLRDDTKIYFEDSSTHSWFVIDNSGSTTTTFTIDISNVPITKSNITINIKFGIVGQTDWSTIAVKKTLSLVVPGIIHNSPTQIANSLLYNKILSEYSPNDQVLTIDEASVDKGSDYVLDLSGINVSLCPNYVLDNTHVCTSDCCYSFKGIEYLIGTYKFNLSNTGFEKEDISYLLSLTGITYLDLSSNRLVASDLGVLTDLSQTNKGLSNLKELNISNNVIDNYSSLKAFASLTKLVARNCLTTDITGLKALTSLSILDISSDSDSATKNGVYKMLGYRTLLDISTLTEVYLYNNSPIDNNYATGQKITTNFGMYNLSTFVVLSDSGVKVYYRTETLNQVVTPIDIGFVDSNNSQNNEILDWQRQGAYVMEGIIFYRYGGADSIKAFYVPVQISSYAIDWTNGLSNLGVGSNAPTISAYNSTTSLVTHTAVGRSEPYEIYASVSLDVNDASKTVIMPFLIYIGGAN